MLNDETRYPALPVDYILRRFRVNIHTGRCFWIDPPKVHPRMIGKEAGTVRGSSSKKYCVIKINKKGYRRAQLIFAVANGAWPFPCLDHKNGDSLDDRAINLRIATRLQNSQNRKIGKPGKELPMGVRLVNGRYQARITVRKKMVHLGCFSSPMKASSVYRKARKYFFGEWA